ncbi:MAG: RluA family pseudouridine synthase [Pseudomonadota bacterium]
MSDEDRAFVEGLVLSREDGVLALNKPSGLPTQTRGNRGRNLDHLLWAFARSNGKRPRLLHRLDTGTSGVVLAAETQPLAVYLSKHFETRSVAKTYLALVHWDRRENMQGVVDAPLGIKEGYPVKAIVSTRGKRALTRWHALEVSGEAALLEITPETGRMHQIRAHLASIGIPIFGDTLYGGPDAVRLMLHALSIEVELPGGERRVYSAPVGSDWEQALCACGLG